MPNQHISQLTSTNLHGNCRDIRYHGYTYSYLYQFWPLKWNDGGPQFPKFRNFGLKVLPYNCHNFGSIRPRELHQSVLESWLCALSNGMPYRFITGEKLWKSTYFTCDLRLQETWTFNLVLENIFSAPSIILAVLPNFTLGLPCDHELLMIIP
jgi:hypothetical protein